MPRCSQVNCRIAETGICLDGHKQDCPHQIPDGAPSAVEAKSAPAAEERKSEAQRFHSGEKLTAGEVSTVLNDRPALVVLCVGSQWAGKTTFLARIGELFRAGTFSQFRFAESLTLAAFERATWRATIESGGSQPETLRTSRAENDTFYHLSVRSSGEEIPVRDLLISDLAGETFPAAVASVDVCKDLRALGRCDILVVFLDAKRISDPAQRHPECDNARAFLQRVAAVRQHDAKRIRVQVVFSRWDYVSTHPRRTELERFAKTVEADLTDRFTETFQSITTSKIMARPHGDTPPSNDEIQALFGAWVEPPPAAEPLSGPRIAKPVRDFNAFGLS